jgi:diguanylate cyclase (GGDEF)-like protein
MRLLAAGIVRPWRQLEPYLNRFGLQVRMMGPPDVYNEPELAVALHNACAEEHPVEKDITDGLTGLMTRPHFIEALDEEWRRSTRTGRDSALILMDLDRFKLVIDRKGRLEGDKVLTAVAALLAARSKLPNVVARYGEDEFAILMPETNTQQAGILAEGLRLAVDADDFLRALGVTASFGVVTFPHHGLTAEEIRRLADCGVCLAKHHNGNCVKVASLSPVSFAGDWHWQG